MIRVLLVDDHKLVRTGTKRILTDAPGIEVVGEADSGEEAISFVRDNEVDVILMDLNMPGIGGLEATRKILAINPGVKVIILTVHDDDPFPSRLLHAGAAGYLTKNCAADEIIEAISSVHAGKRHISAEIAQSLALTMLNGGDTPFDKLSQREMQVMLMVTQGYTIQETSDRLHLSPKTVSTYRYRLYEKLKVNNDVELTHMAIRHGVIDANSGRPKGE